MKKLLTVFLVLAIMIAGFATSAFAANDPLQVVFVCIDMQGAFWVEMMKGAEVAAADYGIDLQFKSGENSLEKQISIIDNLIIQGVDAIIVDPLDAEGIKPALEACGEAGIPIVTAGNNIDTEYNWCTIYNDVYDLGCITDAVCSIIGGEGKVACVVGAPGSAVSDARQKGFEEAVAKYEGITSYVLPSNWDANVAQQLVTDLLASEPDLNAVICADAIAYQVKQACEAAGHPDVIVTSLAAMDENLPGVEDGSYLLDLLMGPQRIGYWNVAVAIQLAKGMELDHLLYLPTSIIANEENTAKLREFGFDFNIVTVAEANETLHSFAAEFGPDSFDPETMKPA